jgi:hypothetical protein
MDNELAAATRMALAHMIDTAYRGLGRERIWSDIQGARFHPLQEKPQTRYTGRLALGPDVNR